MTDMTEATKAAGAALEQALNSATCAEEQIRIAEMFVVLGANFLRVFYGDEHTRQFLQKGIDDLEHPSVMNVIHIDEALDTKH